MGLLCGVYAEPVCQQAGLFQCLQRLFNFEAYYTIKCGKNLFQVSINKLFEFKYTIFNNHFINKREGDFFKINIRNR